MTKKKLLELCCNFMIFKEEKSFKTKNIFIASMDDLMSKLLK